MDERKKILELLSSGKISVQEAEQLLNAVGSGAAPETAHALKEKKNPKYLRIQVNSLKEEGGETVNVRVPFNLLKAGVKLAGLIPSKAQSQVQNSLNEHGIDFDLSKADPAKLEELVEQLAELQVDVDSANEKVKIFVE